MTDVGQTEPSGLTGHIGVWTNDGGQRVLFMVLTGEEAQAAVSAVEAFRHRHDASRVGLCSFCGRVVPRTKLEEVA